MSRQLSLKNVRNELIRLEETIIFAVIERSAFQRNAVIYQPGAFGDVVKDLSLMGYCLRETECVHARMRRYTSPDEHPFFHDLPEPLLPKLAYSGNPLRPNTININDRILKVYQDDMIPLMCEEGDDEQYGSSCVCDVACLQAMSRRIHYGKFVAESKFRAMPEVLKLLVTKQDAAGLLDAVTDDVVENKVLQRLESKASTYTRELNGAGPRRSTSAGTIVEIYRRWVIPMNKDVQVAYLLQRGTETS